MKEKITLTHVFYDEDGAEIKVTLSRKTEE